MERKYANKLHDLREISFNYQRDCEETLSNVFRYVDRKEMIVNMNTSIKYKSALYLASEALVSDKQDKVMPLSNHSQNISKSNEIGQNYAIQLFGNNPERAKLGANISQK